MLHRQLIQTIKASHSLPPALTPQPAINYPSTSYVKADICPQSREPSQYQYPEFNNEMRPCLVVSLKCYYVG
jgi:hypothetical protein